MHPTFQLILTLISARVFSPTARHGFLFFYFWGMQPQAAQLLLRFCCGACRVTHLLRTLPPNTMAETATQIDDTMVSTCPWLSRVVTGQSASHASITSWRFWCHSDHGYFALCIFVSNWQFDTKGRSIVQLQAFTGQIQLDYMEQLTTLISMLPPTFPLPRLWLSEGRLPLDTKSE